MIRPWEKLRRKGERWTYRTDKRRVRDDVLDPVERVADGRTLRDGVLVRDALAFRSGEQREEARQGGVELLRELARVRRGVVQEGRVGKDLAWGGGECEKGKSFVSE